MTATTSGPLVAAEGPELNSIEHEQRGQDDDRDSCGRTEVLPLKGLAVNQLDHRDRAVVRCAFRQDVELVKRQQRTGHTEDKGERQRRPELRQRDVSERLSATGPI